MSTLPVILQTLGDPTKIPPISGLGDSASIATAIHEGVQKAKKNTEKFQKLGEESCQLVYHVVKLHEDITQAERAPEALVNDVRLLRDRLKSIQEFVQESTSRGRVKSWLHSKSDAQKIQRFLEQLQMSRGTFKLQFDNNMKGAVDATSNQLKVVQEMGGEGHITLGVMEQSLVNETLNDTLTGRTVEAKTERGDRITNQISNTIQNIDSNNVWMNASVEMGNTTKIVTNTHLHA